MRARSAVPGPSADPAPIFDGAFRLVAILSGLLLVALVARGLIGVAAGGPGGPGGANATPSPVATAMPDPSSFLVAAPRPAPPLELTDQAGQPFALASSGGGPVFVFFGYTHCPDVCPATLGILGEVLAADSTGARSVFVTVDPERDTVAWMGEYVRFLDPGFTGLTGSASEIRDAALAWGVRYARVETETPGAYSMSHTADVFLVDGAGLLRAVFPFGTQADAMLATLRLVEGSAVSPAPTTPGPTATPTPTLAPTPSTAVATDAPAIALQVQAISSSIWAGGASPVILRLNTVTGPFEDAAATVEVRVTSDDGRAEPFDTATAVAVRPPGVDATSWVATVDLPSPGWWRIDVTARTASATFAGTTKVAALDPGTTAPLGASAPDVRTPTLDDVGGVVLRVTTDPVPDLRLSRTSTVDALAANKPFVFIVDSTKFRVTQACGKALILAKYLQDRWADETFIHLEPYSYQVITDTAILDGSLGDPTLVPAAEAWGVGGQPWGAASMPWIFVVDRHGIVRAKYQGIVGSADVDVILALLAAER